MAQEPGGLEQDAAAVARTLAGDRGAFEALVTRHERVVYGVILRMTRQTEDAEDLTQETFLRAYRSLNKFDASRDFRPWLLQIAANISRDHLRRLGRGGRSGEMGPDLGDFSLEALATDAPGPAEVHSAAEEKQLLQRAVGELRGEQAALFHLHYGEDLPVEQIAETLGKRPNTVAVALHRLRQQLCRMIRGRILGDE